MGSNPIQLVVLKEGGIRTQACTEGRSSGGKGTRQLLQAKDKGLRKKKKKKENQTYGHFEPKIVVSRTVRK